MKNRKLLLVGLLFVLCTAATLIGLANRPPAPETKVELGERLFFDPILSSDENVSCASCHKPEFAFADDLAFSEGIKGQKTSRNTPSCMNMSARPYFFYDGRAATLAAQAIEPIQNPMEMNLPIAAAVERLRNTHYDDWFQRLYKASPDSLLLGQALAAYIFTLESPGTSPFDKWMNGKETAMTAEQIAGRAIFMEKGKCFDCHFSPDFTGDEFRNIGLFNNSDSLHDVGRFAITKDSNDIGKMKVPGLRNIAMTAPYMHNGMFQTLEEVVDYYDNPSQFVQGSINRDSLLQKPLGLTDEEKKNLVAFMHALTDKEYQ